MNLSVPPGLDAARVEDPGHGVDDPRTTLADGRRVFDAVTSVKTFEAFADTGHESYLTDTPDQWRRAIRLFVESLPAKNPDNQ
jgi:cyclopropane fatty-acyl-phospholipid synthase-like methyltransferase